ncbi:hypothetical protein NIES2107_28170 [Nostoc carneum NIES-2107]|nr:hypothetical protein NIES2107_28170 [Nostoc carneum NIES-2107]
MGKKREKPLDNRECSFEYGLRAIKLYQFLQDDKEDVYQIRDF